MRTRILSLAVIGSMLFSAPAFAQSEASSEPEQEWIHGALIGGVVTPLVAGVVIARLEGCPKPGFEGLDCLGGALLTAASIIPGALVGGLIEWHFTKPRGDVTATLIPSTNGRDTASLHLLVRF